MRFLRSTRAVVVALVAAALGLAVLIGGPVAFAQPPIPTPVPIPTTPITPAPTTTVAPPTSTPAGPDEIALAQLCAATGIPEVDAVLADLAETDLVGQLGGLADLVVIDDADNVELDAATQLDDVRRALNCEPAPTTTATPVPTDDPDATPTDDPPTGGSQVPVFPSGGVETGGA